MKLLTTLFVLVSCLSLSHCRNQEDCQQYVNSLLAKYPTFDPLILTPQESYYVQFSGRGGNWDFGHKVLCEKQPSMVYYILLENYDTFDNIHYQTEVGLCVIKQCTPDIIRNTPGMLISLFRLNNWPIQDGELYDIYAPLPKTSYFYGSVALHVILVSALIISTILAILIRTSKTSLGQKLNMAFEGRIPWYIDAYDVWSTLKGLYKTAKDQKQNENLAIFGFVRVIAMWWVVSTHTWGFVHGTSKAPGSNCSGACSIVQQGPWGVNVFFVLGAFLAVYTLGSKFMREELTLPNLVAHLRHRWMRVWPLTIMAIIFYWLVLSYAAHGPMMGRMTKAAAYCEDFWGTKASLAGNYLIPDGPNCAIWTWYIEVDIQVYIFVLFLIFMHVKSSIGGYLSCFFLFWVSHQYSMQSVRQNPQLTTYYINSASRAQDIFLGAFFRAALL